MRAATTLRSLVSRAASSSSSPRHPSSTLFPYTTLFRSEAVRRNITHRVETMTGLHVKEVNISVVDLYFPGDVYLLHVEARSEEHTSELQSLRHLVCRLLLEKKNQR